MKVLCEQFGERGIPVLVTDVKGDFSGIVNKNESTEDMLNRAKETGYENYTPRGYSTEFLDVYRKEGLPIRFSVSDVGPLFLSELLGLNDAQTNHLYGFFRFADENGFLLIDFKDLLSPVRFIAGNYKNLREYGSFAPQSIAAIERKLSGLEYENGDLLFGEPAWDLRDLLDSGKREGTIHLVNGKKFTSSPLLYSIFLTKLLSDLLEELPEVGNPDYPVLVLFFDEAHILFKNSSSMLKEKILQAIRMVRSKDVGIWFVTQNPKDIPEDILGQLGNRILYQMRAFTPKEVKEVKAAAQYLPENPAFDTAEELTKLKTGEALISVMEEDGSPSMIEKGNIYPPRSDFSPISREEIKRAVRSSRYYNKYFHDYDPESAYEILKDRVVTEKQPKGKSEPSLAEEFIERTTDSFFRTVANRMGRELARNFLGNLKKR